MPQTLSRTDSHGFLINGQWREEGREVEIRAPYDQQVVGRVHQGTRKHAEEAIAAAVGAFELTRQLPTYERQRVLRAVAAELAERKEEFARTIAQEAGKPLKAARVETERAVMTFTVAAEEAARIYGEWLPLDLMEAAAGRWAMVRRFPLGAVGAITPFNFPLNLVAHKVAPAIRVRLQPGAEAGAANAAERPASGGSGAAGGLAGGRAERAAAGQ